MRQSDPTKESGTDYLRRFIEGNGYEVITGTTGRHAVPMNSGRAVAVVEKLEAERDALREAGERVVRLYGDQASWENEHGHAIKALRAALERPE